MAARKSGTHRTKARARKVAAEGTDVRDRVRRLSIRAFRDRNLKLSDAPKIVHEVLEGAIEGIDESIPTSRENVLREVYDGLNEGMQAIASAGSAAAREVGERGRDLVSRGLPSTARRIRQADEEFLRAVKGFASKTSKQAREELESLMSRTQRTGSKVAGSARRVVKASDGRLIELTGETARAGIRVARRTAGALAMGAGGLLEGLAEVITPRRAPAKRAKATASGSAAKKRGGASRRKKTGSGTRKS